MHQNDFNESYSPQRIFLLVLSIYNTLFKCFQLGDHGDQLKHIMKRKWKPIAIEQTTIGH